jgi:hypothetical protein
MNEVSMKRIGTLLFLTGGLLFLSNFPDYMFKSQSATIKDSATSSESFVNVNEKYLNSDKTYKYPEFYRGIYLTVTSANNIKKLQVFIDKAKSSNINTLVLDVQIAKSVKCMVPEELVKLCKDNDLHPVARIVVFPDGIKKYPVPETYIEDKLAIAEDACKNGFKEIQFDYIRFHDSGSTRLLTYGQRYRFIENFLISARNRVKKYNARIAADIFGRVPLNTDDIIGQKIESLDKVVDMICPMAYPSHYTWSRKYYSDPYYTVFKTSTQAKLRSKNAMIVTYIQAFKMKMTGIPFEKYLHDQLKAIHDSEIKGFILWNARQEYDLPLAVVKNFYLKGISKKEKPVDALID